MTRALIPHLPAGLFLLALVLFAIAAATPAHTDAEAYEAAIAGLPNRDDYEASSKAFFAAQSRYATLKWRYADMGYALIAWSAVTACLSPIARFRGWSGLLVTSKAWARLAVLCVFGVTALVVGVIASVFHDSARHQLPHWADSLGIPIFGAFTLAPWLLRICLVLTLATLPFGAAGQPLLVLSRPPHWASSVISLVYAAPLAICAILVLFSFDTGGWATGPAGLALGWLFLNARAAAIAGLPGRPPGAGRSGYPPQNA